MRRQTRPWMRRLGVPVVVIAIATFAVAASPRSGTVLTLRSDGLAIGWGGSTTVVPAHSRSSYHPGSSVLSSVHVNNELIRQVIADERAWLTSGRPPSGPYADMAERALLDLRLLTTPEGGFMGAPVTMWRFVWPRDSAYAVAALAATGYHDDAARILGFLAGVAPEDGVWEARYHRDGSGPLLDGRPPQMDGAGWVPWATWTAVESAPDRDHERVLIEMMGAAVIASADAIADRVGPDGLPEPSSDYWEREETEPTLGVAAPMSFGLRSAIALAPRLGADDTAWRAAAQRLESAIEREFGAHGYPRTVPDGGLDAAVTFLAPPFAPESASVRRAVVDTEQALQVPNGGHRPGENWTKDLNVGWTPETAMLALAFAGLGDTESADRMLRFLSEHRTALGALPEKVDARGRPSSVAPLGMTGALAVLAMVEMSSGLPVLPDLAGL